MGRNRQRKIFVVICDNCNKKWETKSVHLERQRHYCSKSCYKEASQPGGVVDIARKMTNVEKFGADNPYASDEGKSRIKKTLIEKYGVDNAFKSEEVKKKLKQTFMLRYGVENPSQSKEVQEKIKKAMISKYGVERPMQLERVKEALRKGCMDKHGVPNVMMKPELVKRIIEKRAAEGTLYQSKPENSCYELLCEKFGKDEIVRQVNVNKFWVIDFYIKTIDTYLQFDGVYWHGLNRPIDEIRQSDKSRDKAIYRKWLVDRQQEKWFEDQGKRLVRITDKQFLSNSEESLISLWR